IFAGNKNVPLSSTAHSLKLNEEAVRAGAQTDLDSLGIAKNAREEKLKARHKDHAEDSKHHEEMARLYRQHVLKEQPTIQIQGLRKASTAGAPESATPERDVQPVLHKPTV